MPWDLAIEDTRARLLLAVRGLFAAIGLVEGATVEKVSKPLYRFMLGRLRAAEAAVRRLIIVAARTIVIAPEELPPARPRRKGAGKAKAQGDGEARPKRKRRPLFRLFDPLRRIGRRFGKKKRRGPEPRAYFFPPDPPDTRHPIFRGIRQPEPEPPPPPPPPPPDPVVEAKADDGMADAGPLIRRLIAMADALQDIPRQALRYARWQARPPEERHPRRQSAMRPGRPPGWRERPKDEIDRILKECHLLARHVTPLFDDTS
ncbi:MAG: hypothetical protein JNM20_04035 [Rhizobiales bacterium]|nr:hypothetical protein [Hyphomicrobiales bacterium]